MKRLNLRDRYCPKCGGKIGVIRRATVADPWPMLGCVGGTHVQVQGTYGYDADDFPRNVKPPSKKEIDKFIAGLRFPCFAAFVVNKLMNKFRFNRVQAEAAWKARA